MFFEIYEKFQQLNDPNKDKRKLYVTFLYFSLSSSSSSLRYI